MLVLGAFPMFEVYLIGHSVTICEGHPFHRQPIYVGRLDFRLPVTIQISVAEVVRKNKDNA